MDGVGGRMNLVKSWYSSVAIGENKSETVKQQILERRKL